MLQIMVYQEACFTQECSKWHAAISSVPGATRLHYSCTGCLLPLRALLLIILLAGGNPLICFRWWSGYIVYPVLFRVSQTIKIHYVCRLYFSGKQAMQKSRSASSLCSFYNRVDVLQDSDMQTYTMLLAAVLAAAAFVTAVRAAPMGG